MRLWRAVILLKTGSGGGPYLGWLAWAPADSRGSSSGCAMPGSFRARRRCRANWLVWGSSAGRVHPETRSSCDNTRRSPGYHAGGDRPWGSMAASAKVLEQARGRRRHKFTLGRAPRRGDHGHAREGSPEAFILLFAALEIWVVERARSRKSSQCWQVARDDRSMSSTRAWFARRHEHRAIPAALGCADRGRAACPLLNIWAQINVLHATGAPGARARPRRGHRALRDRTEVRRKWPAERVR